MIPSKCYMGHLDAQGRPVDHASLVPKSVAAELDRREGGAVKRFHCWPILGEQTVGHHSWGVARLLVWLYPNDLSKELLIHAINHDLTEVRTGDIPSHVKWKHPEIKPHLKALEEAEEREMGLETDALSKEDARRLKIADWMEMLFFSIEQARLGSKAMDAVFERVCENLPKLGVTDREAAAIGCLKTVYHEVRHG